MLGRLTWLRELAVAVVFFFALSRPSVATHCVFCSGGQPFCSVFLFCVQVLDALAYNQCDFGCSVRVAKKKIMIIYDLSAPSTYMVRFQNG